MLDAGGAKRPATTEENRHGIGPNVASKADTVPARRCEYERVLSIARHFSLCRWARRLLLDRRCRNLCAAFSVPVAARRPSSVLPATVASATAAAIAHAPLAGVLCVKPIVGISAPSTDCSKVRLDRSGIAIIDASRITVHLQIAPLIYLMRARRTR